MNRTELVERVSGKAPEGVSKKELSACLDLFLGAITDSLQVGEKVSLRNFGTFYTKSLPEREVRNPKTGETITVGPTVKAKFKPSPKLV